MKKLILILTTILCLFAFTGGAYAWGDGWTDMELPYILKTTAPTVTDNDFAVPFLWVDETNDKFYLLIDNTPGAADWVAFGDGSTISTLRLDQNVETLSAAKTLVITDLVIQKLDPNGSDRDVTLPAEASSTDLVFWIYNTANGAGEDLVVKSDAPATIVTLAPGMGMMFTCDGTSWVALDNEGITYDAVANTHSFGSSEVTTTGAFNAATVNTGQGDYELYAMNQDVESSDSPAFVTVDLTNITDTNIPYMAGSAAGFADSPLSTDGADVTASGKFTATGTIHGKIEIIADDNSLSAAQCYGSLNKLNGAESTTLPAAVAGMNVLLYSDDATVKTIAPNGNDHIWLNGVDNGATNSINSPGAVGDYIVLVAFSANNWYSIGQSGTWIDTP